MPTRRLVCVAVTQPSSVHRIRVFIISEHGQFLKTNVSPLCEVHFPADDATLECWITLGDQHRTL